MRDGTETRGQDGRRLATGFIEGAIMIMYHLLHRGTAARFFPFPFSLSMRHPVQEFELASVQHGRGCGYTVSGLLWIKKGFYQLAADSLAVSAQHSRYFQQRLTWLVFTGETMA